MSATFAVVVDRLSEDAEQFSWRRGAISWMAARLLAAVVVTSAVFSWGYNYLYESSSKFADVVVTPAERLSQFGVTAIAMTFLGCVPAVLAIVVELTGRRRTWTRTVISAVAPNLLGAIGLWLICYAGGLGLVAMLLALIIASLGSVAFFLALTRRTPLRSYTP